jgi:hypothetical protein
MTAIGESPQPPRGLPSPLPLDIALFTTDVGTDFYNGISMILQHDPIWGSLTIGLMFVPVAVLGAYMAIGWIREAETVCGRLGRTLACLALALPVALLGTPVMVGFVLYAGIRRIIQPQWEGESILCWDEAVIMKSLEISCESAPQSVLGGPPAPLSPPDPSPQASSFS